jgi:hypothetical protein
MQGCTKPLRGSFLVTPACSCILSTPSPSFHDSPSMDG